MLLEIPEVLDDGQLAEVQALLQRAAFVDGRLSAGKVAKAVKRNEEAQPDQRSLERLNAIVMGALVNHPEYQQGALPHRVAAPYYARYQGGMAYGEHVDDPIMGQPGALYRSDVSITVFLNDPADYAGGELVIETSFGAQPVKLAAGAAILYPSSSLHQVNDVSDGERLVAVTWVQSMVRDAEQRRLLYELNQAREHLLATEPEAEHARQVNVSYANLFRMWAEV